MSKPYTLQDPGEFRSANLDGWRSNSEFWLRGSARHISELEEWMASVLRLPELGIDSQSTIVDVGCGEGWILRILRRICKDTTYVGIDFNDSFVDALSQRHKADSHATFIRHDIEAGVLEEYRGRAHVVVNCFNFFELPNLKAAMSACLDFLRDDGYLVLLTIDPITQMIAISESWAELLDNLRIYAGAGSALGYDKRIDVSSDMTERVYKGILYSLTDFLNVASDLEMRLVAAEQRVSAVHFPPQIYNLLMLRNYRGPKNCS